MKPDSQHQPAVVFVAGDPGGAALVAPVARSWVGKRCAFTYHQATAAFQRDSLGPVALNDHQATIEEASAKLVESCADVLCVATSVNGADWETRFTVAAKMLGIPSLAVLDGPTNCLERFTIKDPMDALPDIVCVSDEPTRDAMTALGVPEDQLIMVGNPVLDEARRWRAAQPSNAQALCREKCSVASGAYVYLFVSQPLGEMKGLTGRDAGNELKALEVLQEVMAREPTADSAHIMIKPHPRESREKFEALVKNSNGRLKLAPPDCHRWDLCLAANDIVGLSSMLLQEAAVLGCRVWHVNCSTHSLEPYSGFTPRQEMSLILASDLIRERITALIDLRSCP